VTAPIEVTKGESESHPEDLLKGVDRKAIEGRSLGQIAWMRLKRTGPPWRVRRPSCS